ncbi:MULTISPECIES: hypothetical protein [unclassified Serratia (in: enterobacteria)]|uniref:hypothetical protein n=1 Tax=unclassified Serratia (in: enterobacteria) TaxID=2647522 RepID=UPI0030763EB2
MENKTSWIRRKIIDNSITILGGLVGGAAVWLSLFFIFYFDSWVKRIISILAMWICIYILAKFFDKFNSKQNRK